MGLRRRVPFFLTTFFAAALVACSTPGTSPDGPHAAPADPEEHAEHHEQGHVHRFENPEDWVEQWNSPDRDEWQKPEEVVGLLEIEPGMRVVDLGTGTGYFVPHLSEAVGPEGSVLATDVEPRMVDYVATKTAEQGLTNVETRTVPADSPDLQPASADRVLVVNTWHHIDDREAYAARLAEGLRPGGVVAVVDYDPQGLGGPPRATRVDPKTIVDELEAGGLEAEIAQESLPHQYVVIARKR